MNTNDKCISNSPRAVMIHGVPVTTYNALQNHIIVLLDLDHTGPCCPHELHSNTKYLLIQALLKLKI